MNYYNEFDPSAAAWLRQLIAEGLIPNGDVDERSIEDVAPADLAGYRQCHFFAGIGGWPLALQLAGWPDDRPVWTGSCPCQPFSVAGALRGNDDPRSLWWAFRWLTDQCRPPVVLGEQVASRDGRTWLVAVRDDLEAMGYGVGAADLCAAGIGAPQLRQRLFWVADGQRKGLEGHGGHGDGSREPGRLGAIEAGSTAEGGGDGRLERAHGAGPQPGRQATEAPRHGPSAVAAGSNGRPGQDHGGWAAADWLHCRDGKWRPVVGSYVSVVTGVSDRMVLGRAAGRIQETETVSGAEADTSGAEGVRSLRGGDGAPPVQRHPGEPTELLSQTVLQQSLHGNGNGEGSLPEREPQSDEGRQDGRQHVRSVRRGREAARPPHQRGPFQQLGLELADLVPVLPSQVALAELHGRPLDAEVMRDLQRAIRAEGALCDTPDQASTAWQSLRQDGQDRINVGFGDRFCRVIFSPLSVGESNRVMRLRGYGNAIVPELAATFIRAALS